MDGSPVRGHKSGIIQLNQVEDPQTFQAEIVRVIRADLPQTEIFFGFMEPVSNTLQVPAWVRSHLERHPGLGHGLGLDPDEVRVRHGRRREA